MKISRDTKFYSILVSIVIIITVVGLTSYKKFIADDNQLINNSKNVIFDGKTDGFSSLKNMEDLTTIIVRGEKIEEKRIKIERSENDDSVNGGFTESSFEINKVYKNSKNDKEIKKGNIISISELSYYDKETDTVYNVNGYEKMAKGEEYLLFLIPVDEGMYSTRGVTFGKISLNKNELKQEKNKEILKNIFKEARLKYKDN